MWRVQNPLWSKHCLCVLTLNSLWWVQTFMAGTNRITNPFAVYANTTAAGTKPGVVGTNPMVMGTMPIMMASNPTGQYKTHYNGGHKQTGQRQAIQRT